MNIIAPVVSGITQIMSVVAPFLTGITLVPSEITPVLSGITPVLSGRWEENIIIDLKEIGINTRNWADSAQDRDYLRALVNTALNLWV